MPAYKFVDTGNGPEFFASGLHEVEVMGSVARFVLYTLRPHGEIMLAESPLSVIMPIEAIGPGIALTMQRCGSRLIVPAAAGVAKAILVRH